MAEKNDLSAAKQDAPDVKEEPKPFTGGPEAEAAEAEKHRKARVGELDLTYKKAPEEEKK